MESKNIKLRENMSGEGRVLLKIESLLSRLLNQIRDLITANQIEKY